MYNCCFLGTIVTKEGANKNNCAMVVKSGTALTNCYYYKNSATESGITPETGATSFVLTSNDETIMTSEKVVAALNNYIDNPGEGVSTSGWLRWQVGEGGLPELIY